MPKPHHTFPRLQTSPNVNGSRNQHTGDTQTLGRGGGGFCSLPHTPSTAHGDPHTPAQRRSIWTAMRRDRQSRIHSIIEARAATAHTPGASLQDSNGVLSVKDLPKAIRVRARDAGWLLGQRTKAKTVRLSELAAALRTTAFDEEDAVVDSLAEAERSGSSSTDPIEQSADFDAIQEIVSLRRTARILLRVQLEHPDAATRQTVDDIMARINSPKKKLKLPVPQALTSGPSFYLPAAKFALEKQLHLFDDLDMDDGSLSSSSEELSDFDDGGPGASADNSPAVQRPGSANASAAAAAAAFAASVSRRGSRAGLTVDQEAHAAHLAWVRKYAEYSNTHWEYGAPHLFQLLNPLPQCGFAMAGTFESIFRVQRSSIKEPEACYLLAAAAAQVGSYPLVCLAEERVIASCYDDGDVYEAWLSQGITVSSAKMQLLARFGSLMAARPWAIAAQDVKLYVDEYVRIHSEALVHQAGRQRGDSGSGVSLPQRNAHRSLSTSVVSGAPAMAAASKPMSMMLSEFSRKSLEENAIRDLLHCIMVMAVGHGLGSFASACGIAPDLDQPAGSFFGQMDSLVPVEIVAGLSYVRPPPSPGQDSGEQPQQQPQQQQQQQQRQQAWVPPMFMDQVERNTADLIFRLQFGTPPEIAGYPSSVAQIYSGHSNSHPQHHTQIPKPPVSMLRHISGPGTHQHPGFFMRKLGPLDDPMESSAPQFAAYRHMRARKLARYELPTLQQQQQQHNLQSTGLPQHFVSVQVLESGIVPSTSACASAATSPTSPLQMVHSIAHKPTRPSSYESKDLRMPAAPRSVHLSQREDLRWDVLTSYLQQQLSINDDHLGNEVQAARGMTGRPFVEAAAPHSQDDDHSVFLADTRNAPLKSDATKPEWERSMDGMDDAHAETDLKQKSFSLSGILSLGKSLHDGNGMWLPGSAGLSEASRRAHMNALSLTSRTIDVRRFHDAIWHFTMSLYHIYEEYYFYNKYKNETTPDNSQSETLLPGGGATTIPVPVQSPDAITVDSGSMEVDYEGEMSNLSGYLSAGERPQDFNIWLTDDLKSHIRSVVRSPDSVSAFSAQPSVATGLNLCAEEMVLINLIISLAKRQAEIIHGIRAIREYERFISD